MPGNNTKKGRVTPVYYYYLFKSPNNEEWTKYLNDLESLLISIIVLENYLLICFLSLF